MLPLGRCRGDLHENSRAHEHVITDRYLNRLVTVAGAKWCSLQSLRCHFVVTGLQVDASATN